MTDVIVYLNSNAAPLNKARNPITSLWWKAFLFSGLVEGKTT
jgi:hypothetical protein